MVFPPWEVALSNITPHEYVGGDLAAFLAFLNFAVPTLFALFHYAHARRLSTQADRAKRLELGADAPIDEGREYVCGVVEVEGDPGPAVCVTVHQEGRESLHKRRWTTSWRETRRDVSFRPFVLVTSDGQRVKCEPDERTRLVDDLDGTVRTAFAERIRRATLMSGERAVVRGQLIRRLGQAGLGYRDVGKELVMTSGQDGMAISTHGLETPLRVAAAARRKCATFLLILMTLAQIHIVRWHESKWNGRVEAATVTGSSSHRVKTRNGYARAYNIEYQVASESQPRVADIDKSNASTLTKGRIIPVRVASLTTTIGATASENLWFFVLPAMLLVGAIFLCSYFLTVNKPWYEQTEIVDARPGKLADDCPNELRTQAASRATSSA